MRCFFIRGGHVVAAEELTGLADEEAVAKAHMLFSERNNLFDGFEVWDLARMLFAHPHLTIPENPPNNAGNSDNAAGV